MIRSLFTGLALLALTASTVAAGAAREITWDNLIPAVPPLIHPFSGLTPAQRGDMDTLAMLHKVAPGAAQFAELRLSLSSEGLDVDDLLSRSGSFEAEIARRNGLVVGELEGELVRMPGYVLPLEFSEAGVKEFLLVPYIGACIHVPPPPPNQMVFVRLDESFTAQGLYRPVWVTGRMTVEDTSSALSFVDGQAQIAASYILDGITVEPYE
jgi:hypothetical protein